MDVGITELIVAMNIRGLRTTNSCEGGMGEDAYVQFAGPLAKAFMHAMLAKMLEGRDLLGGLRFNSRPNSSWPATFSRRWLPFDYPKVLRYAKSALHRASLAKAGDKQP